jgi:ATP-dependent DNA ligase
MKRQRAMAGCTKSNTTATACTTRINGGMATLLTRTGLDWSHRYRRTVVALQRLSVKSAYLDGELCALNNDGVPVFSRLQAAMDEGRTDELVFFAFDLLFIDGENIASLPLVERKSKLKRLFRKKVDGLLYSEHVAGDGPRFGCTHVSSG